MNLRKLIMASVATMGVFRRFAQLSDEEKEEVVNKVKEKLNVKDESSSEGEESPEEESTDDAESEEDTTESVDESDDESESDDGEADESESGDEGESDDEEVDAVPEEGESSESEPEAESELEPETEPEAEPEADPDNEEKKNEITDIVNNLVEEVETIKQDGNVAPKDVLGLITNMMEMVNLLVQAKPPIRRRKKSGAEREFLIAEDVAKRTAGYSYAISPLNLELEGWQPFNVDVIHVLSRDVSFDFRDEEEGKLHDDGRFRLMDYKRISPIGPLSYHQEQEMKKRREAPVYLIRGQIPMGSSLTALRALSVVLGRKFGYKVSEAR